MGSRSSFGCSFGSRSWERVEGGVGIGRGNCLGRYCMLLVDLVGGGLRRAGFERGFVDGLRWA